MHRWPESLFRYPVFEAISLFFPLSLSEGGDEEDLVCLRVEMRKMYFIPTHNVSSHGWGWNTCTEQSCSGPSSSKTKVKPDPESFANLFWHIVKQNWRTPLSHDNSKRNKAFQGHWRFQAERGRCRESSSFLSCLWHEPKTFLEPLHLPSGGPTSLQMSGLPLQVSHLFYIWSPVCRGSPEMLMEQLFLFWWGRPNGSQLRSSQCWL